MRQTTSDRTYKSSQGTRYGAIGQYGLIGVSLLVLFFAFGSLFPLHSAVGQLTGGQLTGEQSTGANKSEGRQLSLADQLRVGLKVKTSTDKKLVAAVVKAVELGRLPRDLVDSTFLWARKRAQKRSKSRALRPIIYFQPALLFRAKKLGIRLPVIEKIPSVAITQNRFSR